jgi:hypothetical protein
MQVVRNYPFYFVLLSIFRIFAIELAKILDLGIKNK